ncbi:MAG TPA: glycosyltransferase, partial [Acidimicrobiales bacterium]|nr:glycosyltransferase [Acidimicrobiales bacterium]
RSAGDAEWGRRLAGADRYILALGTVEPRKDLPALVRSFDLVASRDAGAHLVVAGPDGWGLEAFGAAVAAARHRSRIRRLGYVSGPEKAALLAGASVFAFPSIYEGFGLPALEAMAAAVPVVATAGGALPEVLGDGAVLVPVGDVEAMATAMRGLLRTRRSGPRWSIVGGAGWPPSPGSAAPRRWWRCTGEPPPLPERAGIRDRPAARPGAGHRGASRSGTAGSGQRPGACPRPPARGRPG